VIEVQKERTSRSSAAFHEIFGAGKILSIDFAPDVYSQLFGLPDFLTFFALDNEALGVAIGVIPRISGPQGFIVGSLRPVEDIKPMISRPAAFAIANMPLAEGCGRISGS
jgi:hypothetical protein